METEANETIDPKTMDQAISQAKSLENAESPQADEVQDLQKPTCVPQDEGHANADQKSRLNIPVSQPAVITCREDLDQVLEDHASWLESVLNIKKKHIGSGRANLKRADLSGYDLSGVNLSGATLREATLIGTNFSNANLTGADLSNANLQGAKLTNARLKRANLMGADLRDADTEGADFRAAKRAIEKPESSDETKKTTTIS